MNPRPGKMHRIHLEKMMGLRIEKYQLEYKRLTKELYNQQKELYEKAVIFCRIDEINNKFGYLVKINKPNASGTKMTFSVCNTYEEWEREIKRLKEDADQYGIKIKMEKRE